MASSQSESASPGSPNLRRRSEMKYARRRICSSDAPAGVPASGGVEVFPFWATGLFLRAGPELPRFADVWRTVGAFVIFIPVDDSPGSGGDWLLFWTIFVFFGTD